MVKMLKRWQYCVLILVPVFVSVFQLIVRFLTVDQTVQRLSDLFLATVFFGLLIQGRSSVVLLFITICSVVQTILVFTVFQLEPLWVLHVCVWYVYFPYRLALSYSRFGFDNCTSMVTNAILLLALLNFIVMPIELQFRGGLSMVHLLNFSGRTYELMAILILAMTLSTIQSQKAGVLLWVFLFGTAAVSFSRGAIALAIISCPIGEFWQLLKSSRLKMAHRRIVDSGILILIIIAILGLAGFYYSGQSLDFSFVERFWIARMNLDFSSGLASNIDSFLMYDERANLWSIGMGHISEWWLTGTGIATTSKFIETVTLGEFAYSGYHNLAITAIAERGLGLGLMIILFIGYLLVKLILLNQIKAVYYFICFLIFTHTTGSELVIHSDHVRNSNVLFMLFVVFLQIQTAQHNSVKR